MPELSVNYPIVIGIPRPDRWFDYVRQRFLTSAIPADKWLEHIQECVRVCASDGWVEFVETNGQIAGGGPACQNFNAWTTEGFKARGIDINLIKNLDKLMREAGLINVTKQTLTSLLGSKGGRAGELFSKDFRLLNNALQPAITRVFNVPKEDVERNATLMAEEFESYQAYSSAHVYLGQKQ
jgi:hypothetical protein